MSKTPAFAAIRDLGGSAVHSVPGFKFNLSSHFPLPAYPSIRLPAPVLLETAIDRLYSLNVGVVGVGDGRHERPHKPLLLLAAFDFIDAGFATPRRIPWCQALRHRFTGWFLHSRRNVAENDSDCLSFLALEGRKSEVCLVSSRLSHDGFTGLVASVF